MFYQVPNFTQIWISTLSILPLVGLGFRNEFVVMYVDVVRPSITSSSCLNSGHCRCGTVINGVLSLQWFLVPRIETWRCRIKPACFNFTYSPLCAFIKVPFVLIPLMSIIVSPTMSVRLSPDIPHVYIISAISLPFISSWVIPLSFTHISLVIISPGRPKTVPVFSESLICSEEC